MQDPSPSSPPLVALALTVAVFGLAGIDFGQREHLMFILVAPYLVLRVSPRSTFLSTTVNGGFPTVNGGFPTVNYSRSDWASPYSGLWWVQAAHAQHPMDTVPRIQSAAELNLRNALVEALVDSPPDVVFVAWREPQRFVAAAFPYVEYLSQDPRFRELWTTYRYRGVLGRYLVFVRVDRDSGQVAVTSGQAGRVSMTNW